MFKKRIRNVAAGAPSSFAYRQDAFQVLAPANGLRFDDYPFKVSVINDESPVLITPGSSLSGGEWAATFKITFSINPGNVYDVASLGIPLNEPFMVSKEFDTHYLIQTAGRFDLSPTPLLLERENPVVEFSIDNDGNNITNSPGILFEIHHEDITTFNYKQAVPISKVKIKSTNDIWKEIGNQEEVMPNSFIPPDTYVYKTIVDNDPFTKKEFHKTRSYRWLYRCNFFGFYGFNQDSLVNDYNKGSGVPVPEPGETTWLFVQSRQLTKSPVLILNDVWLGIRGTKNV